MFGILAVEDPVYSFGLVCSGTSDRDAVVRRSVTCGVGLEQRKGFPASGPEVGYTFADETVASVADLELFSFIGTLTSSRGGGDWSTCLLALTQLVREGRALGYLLPLATSILAVAIWKVHILVSSSCALAFKRRP